MVSSDHSGRAKQATHPSRSRLDRSRCPLPAAAAIENFPLQRDTQLLQGTLHTKALMLVLEDASSATKEGKGHRARRVSAKDCACYFLRQTSPPLQQKR